MRDIDLERDVVRLPYGMQTVRAGWLDLPELVNPGTCGTMVHVQLLEEPDSAVNPED